MEIRFDERVAIVTGAGRGLGRQYAMDLAARGAKIVVNDLGGTVEGQGQDPRVAQSVVNEIVAAGGTAVANAGNVASEEGALTIAETALSTYGRIDIIVNNSGISKDVAFNEMTSADFFEMHRVHVGGAFHCTKAVWPHMMKQRFGRVIFVTSSSGLYGLEGQVHYGSAKAAILGLTHALSLEGQAYNILVNAIAPFAYTRMSEPYDTPAEIKTRLAPEAVSPLVLFYANPEGHLTNQVIEGGMGYFGKSQIVEAEGFFFGEEEITPEGIQTHFDQISDMTNARAYNSVNEHLGGLIQRVLAKS